LYGLGGNDYLNGGGGNHVLVGGPGADTLVCGPGVDTALADATYTADCQPSAKLTDTLTAAGAIPINPDLGTFTPDGALVSGTLRVHESRDYQGTHYECDSGIVGWTAAFQR
jgi:RTX calcium-binding nonapeptide repeat (4 copies)